MQNSANRQNVLPREVQATGLRCPASMKNWWRLLAATLLMSCGGAAKNPHDAAYAARYNCDVAELRATLKQELAESFGTAIEFNWDWYIAPAIEWKGDPQLGPTGQPIEKETEVEVSKLVAKPSQSTWLLMQPTRPGPNDFGQREKALSDKRRRVQREGKLKVMLPTSERDGRTLVVFATTEKEELGHRVRLVARLIEDGAQMKVDAPLPLWAQDTINRVQVAIDKKLAPCRVAVATIAPK